jgi:hypothetical protein
LTLDFVAMPKFTIERVSGVAKHRLPAALSREIGRIITSWAYFEYAVQEMVWQTMEVPRSVGRIAIREPRVTDRLEMLRDLIKLRKGEWDDDLFKSVLERAKIITARRDLLAHGIWGTHPSPPFRNETWHVELTRGSWPKNVKDLIEGSKKITPELVPMDLEKLRSTTGEIEALIDDLKRLRKSAVGPPLSSPQKSP